MVRPDAELDRRIRERARHLWVAEGKPEGRDDEFLEKARELIAVEDNQAAATKPAPDPDTAVGGRQPVESPRAVENQGEFPGLTDQGEQTMAPTRKAPRRGE